VTPVEGGTDFLILGSGIAGLRAAADLTTHGTVTILTKADPTESNTGYAQGGIAAAVGPEDSPEEHFADTMAAGDGLCEEDAVRALVEDGVTYVRELVDWGAAFDRDATGQPALGREGAHRVRRVLHARDATGREIGRLLWSRVAANPRVRVYTHARAVALTIRDGRCVGALFTGAGGTEAIEAGAVLLATGGAGQVYSDTTNPPIATGDGVALAFRAGAAVVDMEFVQFHPTALSVAGAPRFLMSEALRGEGAYLVNGEGERFMLRYERAGELASRDLVSRAIVSEVARTGGAVFLSLQHLDPDWVHERFPTIALACRSAGLDLARDLIPVGPAAHYIMGGVETDLSGRTTIPGLCAAGEVACTGVHGANRLASNSLLEGLVFGARAVEAMLEPPRAGAMTNVRPSSTIADRGTGGSTEDRGSGRSSGFAAASADARGFTGGWLDGPSPIPDESAIRSLMWNAVGLLRDATTLAPAVEQLRAWHTAFEPPAAQRPEDEVLGRVSSLATVGWLIARAALRREESRGGHFRTDFPSRDDLNWRIHVADCR
jgi:L-aspartate oxidase